MGKRSDFERRPGDFYPTPRAAALPLIAHLRGGGIATFAEPCAGDGALVPGHLLDGWAWVLLRVGWQATRNAGDRVV